MRIIPLSLALTLCACGGPRTTTCADTEAQDASEDTAVDVDVTMDTTPPDPETSRYHFTHVHPTGNPVLEGALDLNVASTTTTALLEPPLWVVGAAVGADTVWVVAGESGRLQAFRKPAGESALSPVLLSLDALPSGTPPLVRVSGDDVAVVAPLPDASPTSHAMPLASGHLAYTTCSGDVVVVDVSGEELGRVAVDALDDGRLRWDGERLFVLAAPSDRYGHGVLGDAIEPTEVVALAEDPQSGAPSVVWRTRFDAPDVIEGIALLVAELDGDSSAPELVVTTSNAAEGARLVVLAAETGEVLGGSEPIGLGYRWRNTLGAAALGDSNEVELVGVRTPHIGGIVERFVWSGSALTLTGEASPYSTHVIGSRNLEMGLVGRLGGAGLAVLVPTQARDQLVLLERTSAGDTAIAWTSPELNTRLSTNLAGVTDAAGQVHVGFGTADGQLHLLGP